MFNFFRKAQTVETNNSVRNFDIELLKLSNACWQLRTDSSIRSNETAMNILNAVESTLHIASSVADSNMQFAQELAAEAYDVFDIYFWIAGYNA